MLFADKVAVVTGASRGIGRSIAVHLADHGAAVACVATSLASAEGTAALIQQKGGKAAAFACDVSSAEQVETLAKAIEEQLGTPTILVNNAGITKDVLIMRMKDSDWDDVLAINLKGSFLCIRAFIRGMLKARTGRIINVSSIIGKTGAAGQANYAASKAGIEGLTKSVAKEFGSRNITCNAVAPGFIETDMTKDLPAQTKDAVIANAAISRLGTPEDIAEAVVFLAGPGAGYITGQTLTVDGGLTL